MRDRQRPKVGEILVRAGVIDKGQLRAALGEQARWGRPLGATLVKLGFVEEKELVRALASQLGLPMAILDGKRIPPDVLALVPRDVAEREMVIPLFVKQEGARRLLYLGVEDPGNLAAFDDLAFRTGMEVRPVMVGPSELFEAIDRCYGRPQTGASTQPGVAVVTPGTEELARHWSQAASVVDPPAVDDASSVEGASEAPVPAVEEPPAAPAPVVETTASAPEPQVAPPVAEVAPSAPVRCETPPSGVGVGPAPSSTGDTRTRLILRAVTELLIEKGLLTREEIQARLRELERAVAQDA